jgi:Phosphotransferase enzyme family
MRCTATRTPPQGSSWSGRSLQRCAKLACLSRKSCLAPTELLSRATRAGSRGSFGWNRPGRQMLRSRSDHCGSCTGTGLAATPAALRAQLEGHTTFYPLATIAHELPAVRQFAERENLSDILADWELVEWAVASSIAYRHRSQPRKAIVHTDAHPNNVLFSNGRAILIDCDNVVIDYPFQCLGFTILRFYLSAADRSSRRLAAATQAHGDGDPAFIADLVHGMLSLETAKSVRILFRVMRTGTYANFVDNVSRLHIANLNAIAPLFRDYCCDA